jgi:predicted nucleotidyltransferase
MRKHDAIVALTQQADAIRALGVISLNLFGSTRHDGATAASDLDLFVDYDLARRFSLVELVGIKQLLERRLGVPIDVTTRDSPDLLLRDRIEASAERIF